MTAPTPLKAWQEMQRGNARFVAGEPRHPRQDVERRARTGRRAAPARGAVRLLGLAPRRRDHLRQGPRRPVRRAQRRPGHLGLGRRQPRVRRRRAGRAAHRRARPRRLRRGERRDRQHRRRRAGPAAAHLAADRPDRAGRAPRAARRRPWTARRPARSTPSTSAASTCATPSRELLHSSELISEAVAEGRLAIVGANYRLAEGTAVPDIIVGVVDRRRLSTTPTDWRNDDVTDIEYRIEHDTMGEVRVPKDALYAAQTQRAVENFPISGDPLEPGSDRRARAHQEGRRARQQGARHARRRRSPTPSRAPPTASSRASTPTSSRSTSTRPAAARRRT